MHRRGNVQVPAWRTLFVGLLFTCLSLCGIRAATAAMPAPPDGM